MHVRDWVRSLSTPELKFGTQLWHSACSESHALLVASLWFRLDDAERKMVIVAPDYERALQWQAKLSIAGIPPSLIRQFPSSQSTIFDDGSPERFALSERNGALASLLSNQPTIVIASSAAALERCPEPQKFRKQMLDIKVGREVSVDELVKDLSHMGYEREDPVRRHGGFSYRGGIVDVFPGGSELPTRIEFFGDSIESLRRFDPETQRSIMPAESVRIIPARSVLFNTSNDGISNTIINLANTQAEDLDNEAKESLIQSAFSDAKLIEKGEYFDRLDLYQPLIESNSACLLDYASEKITFLDEPLELQIKSEISREGLHQALQHRHEKGEVLKIDAVEYLLDHKKLVNGKKVIALTTVRDVPDWFKQQSESDISTSSLESYRGQGTALAKAIQSWKSTNTKIFVSTDQPTRAKEVLKGLNIFISEDEDSDSPFLLHGNLAGGFIDIVSQFALLTDAELFGVKRLRLPQRRFSEGAPIASVLDLKPGDYVVHIQYGIGIYRGLVVREDEGVNKEFLHLDYLPPDKLLVPTDQLDRIQKYLSPTDGTPQLHRITGSDWQRTLKNAKKGAEDLARDLIRIYAKRASQTRPSYGQDTPWQTEMEASFQWIETQSQLKAINEIKKDLAGNYPMDRLVCGDVGFGKTEVAIRAAFKVAQSDLQVAVLCPTTVLSDQHFETFKERLAPYPIRIDVLNRFRNSKEKANTLKGLESGEVNIVIGTHTLLQPAVKFKNLGLVIVDEEQRFGVKHKERLKDLRASADFLTLTATPIPRTLSMALMDIRQMSQINDPPPGRMPIRTFVRPFSDQLAREALLRELSRGGQAFYVFNRIDGIRHIAEKIQKLVPNARIAVAHGQMTADELEPIMTAFFHHDIDILVSTTIVENGIDNSNANTLIVDGADKLGLAQLYQLRGRVGRSDRQAYAYMFYRSGKNLTDNAFERLRALQEFSDLGSGYSLAFRDLQIRGAGELLGSKQHGVMATVGYEMYVHLINQAVQQLRNAIQKGGESEARMTSVNLNETPELNQLPSFEIPIGAFLPTKYVPDQSQRLFVYKRLMESRSYEEVAEVEAELKDRFGPLPEPALAAIVLMNLRIRAGDLGIRRIDSHGGKLTIYFLKGREMPIKAVNQLLRTFPGRRFRPDMAEFEVKSDLLAGTEKAIHTLQAAIEDSKMKRAAGTS